MWSVGLTGVIVHDIYKYIQQVSLIYYIDIDNHLQLAHNQNYNGRQYISDNRDFGKIWFKSMLKVINKYTIIKQ